MVSRLLCVVAACIAVILGVTEGVLPEDSSSDLKLLHWVHVPKAGGTAITRLLKKLVCHINPIVSATSPCCRRDLCLHSNACHAAVGGCPLVTAVGRHSTNMALAAAIPCCTTDLAHGITASFMHFSFPSAAILTEDVSGLESRGLWPMVDRAAFIMSTGVSRATLFKHLDFKKYSPDILGSPVKEFLDAAEKKVTSTYESKPKNRNERLGQCSSSTRLYPGMQLANTSILPQTCQNFAFDAFNPNKGTSVASSNIRHHRPKGRVGMYSISILRCASFPSS